ncbi:sensor histidine kinase [Actinomadura hibisca]|uniref:sensor histidine kinase n=1 Tax=Actinomadura hibisca TaxID=68565 RepID=UPI000836A311|nr:histidine kinase [Actinomadura hibisca]
MSDKRRGVPGGIVGWIGALLFPPLFFLAVQGADPMRGSATSVPALVALVLPLGLVARRPVLGLLVLLSGWFIAPAAGPDLPAEVGYLMVAVNDLVIAYLAATRRRRVSLPAAVLTVALQLLYTAVMTHGNAMVNAAVAVLLATVAAWIAGDSFGERRAHAEALRAQATAQAVTAERLRIARELHDMVAHSIGIIAIQAGVGARVIDTRPDEARKALAAIETTSRDTLSGLRRMLGALRRTDAGAEEAAPLDPAPGLADLDRLAAATGDAGVRVEVRWVGERRPLPAEIDLSAYRIVQEAVTNVVRHAGTDACRVTIEQHDGEVAIEIVDDGTGRPPGPGGYGITGMHERVGLLNGGLTAGPRPEGGFRVAARLPLPEPVR